MMPDPKNVPDFFESNPVDPVRSATGGNASPADKPKKKAGFYLTQEIGRAHV